MAQSQPTSSRDAVRDVVPALIHYTETVLFGDVWERPGLSKRDRSLIVVATLIALGREKQLVGHLERALEQRCDQGRAERGHHPSRLLRRLAGRDDRRPRRQGRVREKVTAHCPPCEQRRSLCSRCAPRLRCRGRRRRSPTRPRCSAPKAAAGARSCKPRAAPRSGSASCPAAKSSTNGRISAPGIRRRQGRRRGDERRSERVKRRQRR